jgi:hypothetical protein
VTSSTFGAISAAFLDEGFAPHPDCTYEDSSVRRRRIQEYLESVDWTDPSHVARALRVFERLMDDFEEQWTEKVHRSLRQDGYAMNENGGIVPSGPQLLPLSLNNLTDPAAILEQLERIRRGLR